MIKYANKVTELAKDWSVINQASGLPQECTTAIQNIKEVCHTACDIMNNMHGLNCQDELLDKAITDCKKTPPDFTGLHELLDKLMELLQETELVYYKQQQDCNRASEQCIIAAEACNCEENIASATASYSAMDAHSGGGGYTFYQHRKGIGGAMGSYIAIGGIIIGFAIGGVIGGIIGLVIGGAIGVIAVRISDDPVRLADVIIGGAVGGGVIGLFMGVAMYGVIGGVIGGIGLMIGLSIGVIAVWISNPTLCIRLADVIIIIGGVVGGGAIGVVMGVAMYGVGSVIGGIGLVTGGAIGVTAVRISNIDDPIRLADVIIGGVVGGGVIGFVMGVAMYGVGVIGGIGLVTGGAIGVTAVRTSNIDDPIRLADIIIGGVVGGGAIGVVMGVASGAGGTIGGAFGLIIGASCGNIIKNMVYDTRANIDSGAIGAIGTVINVAVGGSAVAVTWGIIGFLVSSSIYFDAGVELSEKAFFFCSILSVTIGVTVGGSIGVAISSGIGVTIGFVIGCALVLAGVIERARRATISNYIGFAAKGFISGSTIGGAMGGIVGFTIGDGPMGGATSGITGGIVGFVIGDAISAVLGFDGIMGGATGSALGGAIGGAISNGTMADAGIDMAILAGIGTFGIGIILGLYFTIVARTINNIILLNLHNISRRIVNLGAHRKFTTISQKIRFLNEHSDYLHDIVMQSRQDVQEAMKVCEALENYSPNFDENIIKKLADSLQNTSKRSHRKLSSVITDLSNRLERYEIF